MLGVPKSAKLTWMTRLAGMPIVHRAIRVLRVQQVAASLLSVHPITRRLRKSGCDYRIRFLESLLVADEIFAREIYREAFEDRDVRTFIDLGANVGFFTVYAADFTGLRDLVGLSVDANSAMTDEVQWHVSHNRLVGTTVRTGVAGYPPGVTTATFFLNPSNVASSAQPLLNPDVPAKGEGVPQTVPAIDVAAEWKTVAGDRRVNLLKVDVEGFECDLIRNSAELLSLTDRIVIEWHKWVTSLHEIESLLCARGFVQCRIISEDVHAGVAVFDRVPLNPT
jgi:FkbM family methyltransferase